MSVFNELRRRNVFRVAIAYIVTGWLLLQVADVVLNNVAPPAWVFPVILLLVLIGFPIAVILAWAFELTPEGLKKEEDVDRSKSITPAFGRKLDFIIIGLMALALAYFAYDKFVLSPTGDGSAVTSTPQPVDPTRSKRSELSIAVLPFVNMSSDREQDFFSDGISEELLNMLAQLPGLRVAARTSAFQFKGQNQDIAEIADTLNVAHVLEGSVRKSGTKIRITAQLIKADDGFHLWSSSYDRELDDIFAVQDEIATAIIDALKVELALDVSSGGPEQPKIIKAANTDAYEAYLRARQMIHSRGRENLEDAVRYLERSLRLDNNFAPAHAQLAIATTLLLESSETYGTLSLEEVRQKAIPHLDRAQELEPELADVYAGRALLALDTADLQSAVDYARKALALNPSHADAMNWMYLAQAALGRYEEQEATIQQILETDPMTIVGRMNYVSWLGSTGRVNEGHEMAEQLVDQSPWAGYSRHAEMSLIHEARLDEGLSWGLRAHVEDVGDAFAYTLVVNGFIWVGEYDEARRINDSLNYLVDVAEGRFDVAIRATQRKMQSDPENESVIVAAADALYDAGRIGEALPLYERLRDFQPEGRPIASSLDLTMRLAQSRRQAGDEDGAQAAVQIARYENAALRAAGVQDQFRFRTDAAIAAFENDTDGAIAALDSAIQLGLRDQRFLRDPIFQDLGDEPRFIALQQKLDAILAVEHDKVLQLICFNNPAPSGWQPMPETCEGVKQQRVL